MSCSLDKIEWATWRQRSTSIQPQKDQQPESAAWTVPYVSKCFRSSLSSTLVGPKNFWKSDIFKYHGVNANLLKLDHYQFCWHGNSMAMPKAKVLQKQSFPLHPHAYASARPSMETHGKTMQNYIRSMKELVHHKDCFTSWVCNDEGRPPTKIPRPSSCETSRDNLERSQDEPSQLYTYYIVLYSSVRWLYALAAGGKKFTASLPFQPWRLEYLVKWCKANQNIAQAGIIWHWMIPMRTYGLMGALSQVAKANAFALDTDYHSKLHDL